MIIKLGFKTSWLQRKISDWYSPPLWRPCSSIQSKNEFLSLLWMFDIALVLVRFAMFPFVSFVVCGANSRASPRPTELQRERRWSWPEHEASSENSVCDMFDNSSRWNFFLWEDFWSSKHNKKNHFLFNFFSISRIYIYFYLLTSKNLGSKQCV